MTLLRRSFTILIVIALMVSCSSDNQTVDPLPPVVPDPVDPIDMTDNMTGDIYGEIRDISSMELVAEMGVGWNLGNSFDVRDANKTVWGNPLPTAAHIKAIRDLGFETLRIPVTWNFNMQQQAPYTVEISYLDRVKAIVEAGLRNNMHVIINTHHDDWIRPTTTNATAVNARLSGLWTQIANHFMDYGDKLIFEVMNEPRLIDSPEEWSGGTTEGRTILNEFHQTCVDAIRATDGKNATRHIMVSTYAASTTPAAFADLVVPADPNIIISLHSYFPWSFAGQDDGTNNWGSDSEKAALDSELDRIKERWVAQENRPVILGEWGAKNKNNLNARINYVDYYAKAAVSRGLVPIIWDDGGDFGLYDRHAMNWRFRDIAQAVVNAGN